MYSAQFALVIVKFYTKFSTESVETQTLVGNKKDPHRRDSATKLGIILGAITINSSYQM